MEVEVVVAFTLDEAYRGVEHGVIDARGKTVIIDDLTNDVRGTRARPAASPQQLVRLMDRLRTRLMTAGATATVVCQLKPMQVTDVSPYNDLLHDYLHGEQKRGRHGFGCRTQIGLDFLKADGYHIKPQYDSVVDKTYACAILGVPVPFPTPWGGFVPDHVRRRWEAEWPRLVGGEGHLSQNGW